MRMGKPYRPWNPDQAWLLPPSPQDWLPAGDLVYFLLDVTKTLDLSAITSWYERSERGQPPYHPRMMVTLLLHAYCEGVFSSRRIQTRCERDVAYRVIVGEDVPDFRTISDFRKIHLEALSALFVQVLRLCQEAGLVKLGRVALDSTKVKANASRHKAMSYGRMQQEAARLEEEIAALLEEAEATDASEDERYGRSRRGDELPAELARRESRLARIREAKAAVEAEARAEAARKRETLARREAEREAAGRPRRGRPPSPPSEAPAPETQYNFTDPESGIMKTSTKGWDQCGNAQAVVDEAAQVIVAADVTGEANDKRQVEPMLGQAQANVGEARIGSALADTGYFSESNARWVASQEMDGYLATGRIKHTAPPPPAPRGRIPADATVTERMARKLRTKKGRAVYARRKAIVEPVFGQIKGGRGFGQFLLRGLGKMRGEWRLVCLTHNLLKLFGSGRFAGGGSKGVAVR